MMEDLYNITGLYWRKTLDSSWHYSALKASVEDLSLYFDVISELRGFRVSINIFDGDISDYNPAPVTNFDLLSPHEPIVEDYQKLWQHFLESL